VEQAGVSPPRVLHGRSSWPHSRLLVAFYSGQLSSIFLRTLCPHLLLRRYDTGTIGGIIAMEDWLVTFGTPTNLTGVAGEVNGHYLAANNKSLVVRRIYPVTTNVRCSNLF
jgi:hypothetical protein